MVLTRSQTSITERLRLEAQQASEGFLNLEDRGKELLPGIPNEITLQKVTPKLSWKDFCVLSFTSPYWRDAIRSRQVHNARVKSHSAETLILVNYDRPHSIETLILMNCDHETSAQSFPAMALLSMRDGFFAELPPIPHFHRPGIPTLCQSVSLDGKIYVLGGDWTIPGEDYCFGSKRVYVLDLAGHRKWRECAHMQHARQDFDCGVAGGKIYVFGGSSRETVHEPVEMYDPKDNTWSSITPTIPWNFCQDVATVGEEILLINCSSAGRPCGTSSEPLCIKYHPGKDEWRVLTSFPKRPKRSSLFTGQGKLYALREGNIHVLDIDGNSWTQLKSCSFAGIGVYHKRFHFPALLVDDEVAVILSYSDDNDEPQGICLVRSRGFGSELEEIAWQQVKFDIPFPRLSDYSCFMHTVEL